LDRTVDERERELKENVLKLQAEKVNKEKVGPSMGYLFLDEWSFQFISTKQNVLDTNAGKQQFKATTDV
jgi:hypothetical protein